MRFVDAGFGDFYTFAGKEFFLQGGVRLANEDFAVCADYAVPRDSSAFRSGSHGPTGAARAANQTQGSG